ncbi:MAG: phosphoribosylformylglycinamidine synthase subunit PurS, partial [Propionibacteriaceae bacterium]|nr:phosphoribosylformylglycinamidine synthase subunit PurS [Propionibacteriaceae bacterium]
RSSDAPPPPLPDEGVAATRGRYGEAYERLTGEEFDADADADADADSDAGPAPRRALPDDDAAGDGGGATDAWSTDAWTTDDWITDTWTTDDWAALVAATPAADLIVGGAHAASELAEPEPPEPEPSEPEPSEPEPSEPEPSDAVDSDPGEPQPTVGPQRAAAGASDSMSGMARVVVDVMPKPEILDPQGKAVTGALRRLGFDRLTVRQGKRFEVEVDGEITDDVLDQVRDAAEKLFANTVIESFAVRVEEQ